MITLRFTGGTGVAARAIQGFTWSWASHVDFEIDGQWLFGAVPGRGVSTRPVALEPNASRVELYGVEVPAAIEADVYQIADQQRGKPYDWRGVIGFGLHSDWQQADAWFCSELVAWCFLRAGFPLLRTDDVGRIAPRDLLLSPHLVLLDRWHCRRCSHPCEAPMPGADGGCQVNKFPRTVPAGGGRGVAAPQTAR